LPLSVQNQIPCAGSFGCQRIHVILNKHDDKLDGLEEICFMEKLITRKEAAEILGISIATLDAARNNGLISYVQYVQNGCVYFTSAGLQEYIAKCTHRAKPAEKNATYRKPRSLSGSIRGDLGIPDRGQRGMQLPAQPEGERGCGGDPGGK
jgi:hypothetical protein